MKSQNSKSSTAFKVLNPIAKSLVVASANSFCSWIVHQPEFPEEAKKFSKIK